MKLVITVIPGRSHSIDVSDLKEHFQEIGWHLRHIDVANDEVVYENKERDRDDDRWWERELPEKPGC